MQNIFTKQVDDMKKSITPNQIKENNRNLIYQYIYKKEKVSQQDIAYDLHLSRPTVTTNLSSLEEDGLITKDGQIDTEYVGRKASAYTIVPDFRVGIGVEILKKEVKMIIVDLYGKKIERSVFEITYQDEDSYFEQVTSQILSFKDSVGIKDEQILGVGFAMQGLVSCRVHPAFSPIDGKKFPRSAQRLARAAAIRLIAIATE